MLKVGKDRERENRPRVKASVLKEVSVLNQLTQHPNLLAFRFVLLSDFSLVGKKPGFGGK